MTYVIGIDPSSKKLALCWTQHYGGADGNLPSMKTFKLPVGISRASWEANRQLFLFLSRELPLGEEDIEVYLEEPLVGHNIHSTIVQAQVNGAVLAVVESFRIMGVYNALVHVSTWKKDVVGKGNAKKEDAAAWLEKNWPEAYHLAEGDQDLIDAACINRYGTQRIALKSRRLRVRKASPPAAPTKKR